jgi:hypothetical protein
VPKKINKNLSLYFIIFRGVDSFAKLPNSAPCVCKLFVEKSKCQQCSIKEGILKGIMREVSNAIDKSAIWDKADQDEKLVAEKACERALVDQIPRDMYLTSYFS